MFLAAYQACKLNDIFHYDVMMCLAMQNYKAAVVKSGRDEKKNKENPRLCADFPSVDFLRSRSK